MASQSFVSPSWSHPNVYMDANYKMTVNLFEACINNQNYDKNHLEWIILDDGDDNNFDFDDCSVKPLYFHCSEKLTIRRKRNIACRIATGEFVTFFDDDDM